ncbi:unnamed protein product [Oikopleura dioica]|uniref:Protein kinase domain-containing protein n=1 Tax=Oikopleura dioica TaxID=34765 RepID=E4YH16_OIKDI|nr:unnamed protein product [Oikopleura dioica]
MVEETELQVFATSLHHLPEDELKEELLKLITLKHSTTLLEKTGRKQGLVNLIQSRACENEDLAVRTFSLFSLLLLRTPDFFSEYFPQIFKATTAVLTYYEDTQRVQVAGLTFLRDLAETSKIVTNLLLKEEYAEKLIDNIDNLAINDADSAVNMLIPMVGIFQQIAKKSALSRKMAVRFVANLSLMLSRYDDDLLVHETCEALLILLSSSPHAVLEHCERLHKNILAHLFHQLGQESLSESITTLSFHFLTKLAFVSPDMKTSIGSSDIIAVLDGKIRTMDACAVDLRANMLNLLAELTEDSQENILLVLTTSTAWHEFVYETLMDFDEIELHYLAIKLLSNLTTCSHDAISRSFVMICAVRNEICYSLLSSLRRWSKIYPSDDPVKSDLVPKIMQKGLAAFSKVLSQVAILEDMRDELFNYEKRFDFFFFRLLELLIKTNCPEYENNICPLSILKSIRGLLMLLTRSGQDTKPLLNFMKSISRPDAEEGSEIFARSSARGIHKMLGNGHLAYAVLEHLFKEFYRESFREPLLIEALFALELIMQGFPVVIWTSNMPKFVHRLQIILESHWQRTDDVTNACNNLLRISLLREKVFLHDLKIEAINTDNAGMMALCIYAVEQVRRSSCPKWNDAQREFAEMLKSRSEGTDLHDAWVDSQQDGTFLTEEMILRLACRKASYKVVEVLLVRDWDQGLIKELISDRKVVDDIKALLLIYLSDNSGVTDKLDWSSLQLNDVTQQYLALFAKSQGSTEKTQPEIKIDFVKFLDKFFGKKIQQFFLSEIDGSDPWANEDQRSTKSLDKPHVTFKLPPKRPAEVNLSNNRIDTLEVPEEQRENYKQLLENAKRLVISNNRLRSLPSEFLILGTTLTELNLDQNFFASLELAFLNQLPNLKSLSIKSTQIPMTVNHLKISCDSMESHNLEHLDLSENPLQGFPIDLLRKLPGLRALELRKCGIKEIPEVRLGLSFGLKDLRTLNLEHNSIKYFGFTHYQMFPGVQILKLSENRLKYMSLSDEDEERYQDSLTLEGLDEDAFEPANDSILETSRMSEYPDPEITQLHLAKNNFEELPLAAFQLPKLSLLDLSGNQIIKLDFNDNDKRVALWHELRTLNLSNNEIREIPKELGELEELMQLNLSHNYITKLPNELGKLKNVFLFKIDGMRLEIPKTLIPIDGRNPKPMLEFLSHRLIKQVEYRCMRVFVVGGPGSGKSSLIDLLSSCGSCRKAGGLEVCQTTIDVGQGNQCGVFFWKLDHYNNTSPYFFQERACYILVVNLERRIDLEINHLKNWVANIKARAPKSPLVIIGTHADKLPNDSEASTMWVARIEKELKKLRFNNLKDLCFIKATDNNNETTLRNILQGALSNFQLSGRVVIDQKVPETYLQLEQHLTKLAGRAKTSQDLKLREKNKRAYNLLADCPMAWNTPEHHQSNESLYDGPSLPAMTTTDIHKSAQAAGIKLNIEQLRTALEFLVSSGSILYFADAQSMSGQHQDSLQDVYFIDPAWVCRVVAATNCRTFREFLDENSGYCSRKAIIDFLLVPQNVPEEFYGKIIRKMELIGVIINSKTDEYLVPSSLSRGKWKTPVDMLADMTTRFYAFTTMPVDFWSRVISRFLHLYRSETSWNSSFWSDIDLDVRKDALKINCNSGTKVIIQARDPEFMKSCLENAHKGNFSWCGAACQDHKIVEENIQTWLQISVTKSDNGQFYLAEVVDVIDGIIAEWYPGLLDNFIPLYYIFCFYVKQDQKAILPMAYLLKACGYSQALVNCTNAVQFPQPDQFTCPIDENVMNVSDLLPEVFLKDFTVVNPELRTSTKNFIRKEVLGVGGFATVYKGELTRGQMRVDVALKVFASGGSEMTAYPYQNLRKELKVLTSLLEPRCDQILSILGFAVKPEPTLIIELAPHGSLETLIESKKSNRSISTDVLSHRFKHKVALEISQALSYLHDNGVVYRDLKLGNVLVFSFDFMSKNCAKLADYGIAEHLTPMGTTGFSGTAGYSAPEVVKIRLNKTVSRSSAYAHKVDVFSFGLLIHELITETFPWFEHNQKTRTNSEPDKLVYLGLRPEAFCESCLPAWPIMETIIDHCTKFRPSERPNMKTIHRDRNTRREKIKDEKAAAEIFKL